MLCYFSVLLVPLLYAGPPCQPEASSQVGSTESEIKMLCYFSVLHVPLLYAGPPCQPEASFQVGRTCHDIPSCQMMAITIGDH